MGWCRFCVVRVVLMWVVILLSELMLLMWLMMFLVL